MIKSSADVVVIQLFLLLIIFKVQNTFDLPSILFAFLEVFTWLLIANASFLIASRIRDGKWPE
jgi:hypothetical protein